MPTPRNRSYHGPRIDGAAAPIDDALPASLQHDADWEDVLRLMPLDLEATAHATGALRRHRQVRSAADLLRLVLAYVLTASSLRMLAAWALLRGIGHLSDVAVRQRLCHCQTWLQVLLTASLATAQRVPLPGGQVLRLIDATTASRPGATGTDFRVHLGFDLAQWRIVAVEVTDAHGGETLTRYPVRPQDIVVADRGYAHRVGLGHVLAAGAQLIVRINAQNLPLRTPDGAKLELVEWLRELPLAQAVGERAAVVETPHGTFPLRLIAGRLAPAAAEAARRRLREQARKKGRTPSQASLVAAGFVLVVSNLDVGTWSAEQVLEGYRLRWQIELVWKRLKGVLELDDVRARESALAQVYLLGKLLAAVLMEGWSRAWTPAACADWFATQERPVSPWRWLVWWHEALRAVVRGPFDWARAVALLPQLRRYLCDTPRRRRQQAADARLLARLLALTSAPSPSVLHAMPSLS